MFWKMTNLQLKKGYVFFSLGGYYAFFAEDLLKNG